jgi:uncharacterized protein (TIGR03435 family)
MMAKGVVRRRLLLVVAGWMAVAVPVFGQGVTAGVKAPEYDVVAIKPNKSGTNMMRIMGSGDRYSATNISLKMLIENAYNLKTDNLVSGLPGWANSTHFDIEAKMDEDAVAQLQKLPNEERQAQRRLMMQLLLADRFQLKIHHESKELPMYSLVIAKGGFKLKDADPSNTYPNGIKGLDGVSHPGMMSVRDGKMTVQAITISNLANNLSLQLHRQVVDKTGLTGKYDFTLQWEPDDNQGPILTGKQQDAAAMATNSGPSIFTALQEQLGLRLESTKGPTDTIVVDTVQLPSEN